MNPADQYWYCNPCWQSGRPPRHPSHAPSHDAQRPSSYGSLGSDRPRQTQGNSDRKREDKKRPRTDEVKPKAVKREIKPRISNPENPTTLMLRSLPAALTRDMLRDMMVEEGFGDLLNFVYVPTHFQEGNNFGYGFINLETFEDAERCRLVFQGRSIWPVEGWDKECQVSNGDSCQGTEAHIERYKNSPVMHESVPDDRKPALYSRGVRQPFPAPTKLIKKPHARPRRNKIAADRKADEDADAEAQAEPDAEVDADAEAESEVEAAADPY